MQKQLNYDSRFTTLLVVRRLSSYSAAAHELSLTPSAVSQQIHSLERELGYKLFSSTGRTLIPTKECDIVTEYAQKINELCGRMRTDLTSAEQQIHHISVGVTPSVENSSISYVLTKYAQEVGNLQITILSNTANKLNEMLRNYSIDLAIVEGDFASDGLNSILLDTDYLTIAVSNANPLSGQNAISIDELQKQRLILRPASSGTRNLFESHLRKAGMSLDDFNVMLEADNTATIKRLVENNYGVSVLSNKACADAIAADRFTTVKIKDMNMVRHIRIFYREDFRGYDMLRQIMHLYSVTFID